MAAKRGVQSAEGTEMAPGVVRRTLAYNNDVMLCHIELEKGAKVPLHNHAPSQIGFVVSGHARFIGETEAEAFDARAGDGYVIDPNVQHGAVAMEPTVLVEVFHPTRDEYRDF